VLSSLLWEVVRLRRPLLDVRTLAGLALLANLQYLRVKQIPGLKVRTYPSIDVKDPKMMTSVSGGAWGRR
jgi:hypothetical protein